MLYGPGNTMIIAYYWNTMAEVFRIIYIWTYKYNFNWWSIPNSVVIFLNFMNTGDTASLVRTAVMNKLYDIYKKKIFN